MQADGALRCGQWPTLSISAILALGMTRCMYSPTTRGAIRSSLHCRIRVGACSLGYITDVAAGVSKARDLAGEGNVAVAAGDVGGQALALGLVDEVGMDVAPVVFGSGKRYFGQLEDQQLLEDPDVVIRGDRVLHLRYRVRR